MIKKVAIIANSITENGAGIASYVSDLCFALNKIDELNILLIALKDNGKVNEHITENNIAVSLFEPVHILNKSIAYSFGLQKALKKNSFNADLYHINSIWKPVNYISAKSAQRKKIPYIISVHGMLEPWCLQQGKLKKEIFKKTFLLSVLNKAACVHVTGELEYKAVRNYGVKAPIAIIPIGLNTEKYLSKSSNNDAYEINKEWNAFSQKKIILFLSRIHPKKGVDILCDAWADLKLKFPEWHLVIAGPSEPSYQKKLAELVIKKNISDRITFTGAVYGKAKYQLLALADIFVLPTHSENFGIVILEALASGTPVITTTGTPWDDLLLYKCGWYINQGKQNLINALDEALSMNDMQRKTLDLNGIQLVKNKYSWNKISQQMNQLYEWVINQQINKPVDFIKMQ